MLIAVNPRKALQKRKTITLPKKESEADRYHHFKVIYEEHFEDLCTYAIVITNSRALAKDIVSDVFFNLWNSKTDLKEIRELKSYLITSVKNQAITTLSKNPLSFNDFDQSMDLLSVESLNPEDLMIGGELASAIQSTMEALPPHCQLVFKMVKEDSLRYEEVAKELGISVNTVKHHMVTALKRIRQMLDEHFADTPVYKLISSVCFLLMALPNALHIP